MHPPAVRSQAQLHRFPLPAGAGAAAFARRGAFVCWSCRGRNQPKHAAVPRLGPAFHVPTRRFFTTGRTSHQSEAESCGASGRYSDHAFPSRGVVKLDSRRHIEVAGPDAAKFLQGVITGNVANLGAAEGGSPGLYAAFLTPQGRVMHDVFVYRADEKVGERFLIEVDAQQAESLVRHIRRYKLRAKLQVKLLETGIQEGTIIMPDPRAPGLGTRVLTSKDIPEEMRHGDVLPERIYTLRRYLHGIPEGPLEILPEHALAHETNLDLMGGVDFRKGCYVGQELTIRTQHRGVVRKRILPCMLYDGPVPAALSYNPEAALVLCGEDVPTGTCIMQEGKRGRSAGKWLRGMGNLGLALCRLESMKDVHLPGETAAGAFSANDEFVMLVPVGEPGAGGQREEKAVRIKAFVPRWLRESLSEGARR